MTRSASNPMQPAGQELLKTNKNKNNMRADHLHTIFELMKDPKYDSCVVLLM